MLPWDFSSFKFKVSFILCWYWRGLDILLTIDSVKSATVNLYSVGSEIFSSSDRHLTQALDYKAVGKGRGVKKET